MGLYALNENGVWRRIQLSHHSERGERSRVIPSVYSSVQCTLSKNRSTLT